MKSEQTIRRELRRVQTALRSAVPGTRDEADLYGAQQALAWALGEDAAPPSRLGTLTTTTEG